MGVSHTTEPVVIYEGSGRPNLTLEGAAPWLSLEETDLDDPAGRYRIQAEGGLLRMQAASAVDLATFVDILHLAATVSGSMVQRQVGINGDPTAFTNPSLVILPPGFMDAVASVTHLGLTGDIEIDSNKSDLGHLVINPAEYTGDSGTRTITRASSLRIVGPPTAGANAAITTALSLVVDTGLTQLKGILEIGEGQQIRSVGSTEIGFCVTNASLTVGSLGSLVIPVRTAANNNDGTDAEIGNVNGALYFNTNNTSLGVRTGADTTVNVGLAGIIIPGKAPEVAEMNGLYHYNQRLGLYTAEGREFVDETVCVECGQEFNVGDNILLKANALMPKTNGDSDDMHAIFQHLHLHLERDLEFQKLQSEVEELRQKLQDLTQRASVLAAA